MAQDGSPSGPQVSRPRARWPLVVIATVAVTAAVGLPLRAHLARAELRWLERQSALTLADDRARADAEQNVKAFLAVSDGLPDQTIVNASLVGLYQDEQRRVAAVRARLHHAILVDGQLIALRRHLVQALDHRAPLLAGVAAYYRRGIDGTPPPNADDRTTADLARVSRDLAAARAHWHETTPPPSVDAAPYPAAVAALNRLSRWLDQPTGAVLFAVAAHRLVRLDIDASRQTMTNVGPDGDVVARRGYLAYVAGGTVWAVAPDGSGAPRRLAAASYLFAAENPDDIWVVDGSNSVATEVDGSGRVVTGPERSYGVPERAAAGVLIESPPEGVSVAQPELVVWNLATHRVQCRVSAAGYYLSLLAASGSVFAWSGGTGGVHISDVTTCADRQRVASPLPQQQSGAMPVAAFSPDGQSVAVATTQTDLPGDQIHLQVMAIATGTTQTIVTTIDLPVETIVWTGDRLFWLYGGPFAGPTLVGTWKVGDSGPQVLRATNLNLGPPLLAGF